MSEDIKDLIEQIQKEGIQAAEEKAKIIEHSAQAQAASLIEEAKKEAQKILAQAQKQAQKTEADTAVLLTQAARDTLISLRAQIDEMLKRLIESKVPQALEAHELSKIILACIKEHAGKSEEEIIITFSDADLEKLGGLLGELKEQAKRSIIIKPADDIKAGFRISFDAGRSQFDFTDQALAKYIGTYLKPKLNAILEKATS